MTDSRARSKPAANQQIATNPAPQSGGRWLARGLVLFAIIGIIGWFAPSVIAIPALRNQLTKLLFPKFAGSIELGDMSLGWLSPVKVKNLRIRDVEGASLIEVDQFTTTAPLWSMIFQSADLGICRVVHPVIRVQLTDDSSNLEQLLGSWNTARPAEASKATDKRIDRPNLGGNWSPSLTLEVENARIELEHSPSNRRSTIDDVSLRLVSHRGDLQEFDLAVGQPPTQGSTPTSDWLVVRFGNPAGEKVAAPTARQAVVRAAHWKLDRLSPLLPRFLSNADLQGELNADASTTASPIQAGADWNWDGHLSINHLQVSGIDSLKNEVLALDSVDLSGQATAMHGRLLLHEMRLKTDIGSFMATGDFPLDADPKQSTSEWARSLLGDEDYHVDGQIDLKRLAALLPQTLHIREGLEVTSGDIKVQFVGAEVDGARRWSGIAGVTGLTAAHQGRRISWDQPIAARINAHRENQAVIIDQVQCKSDFLQITGSGTLDDARFSARGDLSKLLVNVEQFVDLGLQELSGKLEAAGEIRRTVDDLVEMKSKVVLNDFAYVVSPGNIWRELHLELSVVASARADAKPSLTKIETGELELASAVDRLIMRLQTPIDLTVADSSYSASVNCQGNLASWQNRLRPVVGANDWRVAGDMSFSAMAAVHSDNVEVSDLKLDLQRFEAIGPEWLIADPELKLRASGQWDKTQHRWTSPKFSLIGQNLSADVDEFDFAYDSRGLANLTGRAEFRADMKTLSDWKNRAIKEPKHYLIGALSGTANIDRRQESLVGQINAHVEKFILAGWGQGPTGQPQWLALWKEPDLKFSSEATYDLAADELSLTGGHFDVEGLSVTSAGKLQNCSTTRRIDLKGEVAYDWSILQQRLGPQLAQQVRLNGKDRRPFFLKGSLTPTSDAKLAGNSDIIVASAPPAPSPSDGRSPLATPGKVDLSGQAGIGWQSASLFGFTAGPTELSAQIDQGICRFATLDMAVNEGKIHISPTMYLDRSPAILVIPRERVIDQVNLTPEICANSLKYVAPVLADATQIDGQLSVDVENAIFPVADWANGTANGVFTIHRAQARPGPLAMQVFSIINEIRSIVARQPGQLLGQQALVEVVDQRVPYKLERGRVYHQGMTFLVQQVNVKTSGSVGLDNSLDLVVEVVLKDEWLANRKLLQGMRGKPIQIPITGTFANPRVDPAVFGNLAKQISGSAIDGLLDDKVGDGVKGIINDGIDKLLRGRR